MAFEPGQSDWNIRKGKWLHFGAEPYVKFRGHTKGMADRLAFIERSEGPWFRRVSARRFGDDPSVKK